MITLERSPDYGTWVIPPIPPDQLHATEDQSRDDRGRFASGGGSKSGPSAAKKSDDGGGGTSTAPSQIAQHGDVEKYYGVQSHEPVSKAGMAPKFTARGKVGIRALKLNVLGKAKGQDIFRKAGAAKGFK